MGIHICVKKGCNKRFSLTTESEDSVDYKCMVLGCDKNFNIPYEKDRKKVQRLVAIAGSGSLVVLLTAVGVNQFVENNEGKSPTKVQDITVVDKNSDDVIEQSTEVTNEVTQSEDEKKYSREIALLIETDYAKNPDKLKLAFQEIHNNQNTRRIAADLAKKVNNDLDGWKVKVKYDTNLGVDNKTRTINEFTGEIRGDRDRQTIQSIDLKLPILTAKKEVELTVIREIK